MSEATLARPFGVAVGVHLTVGSVLVVISWLSLGALPKDPEPSWLFNFQPQPIRVVLEGGGARPVARREAPRPAPKPQVIQQPIVTPDPVPHIETPPQLDDTVVGDPTVVGADGPSGTGGSGIGEEGPGPSDGPPGLDPISTDDGPIGVSGTMTPPRLVLKVSPEYPRIAIRSGMSGTVVLRAVIGPDGSVEEVELVSATNPLFVEAARSAVLRWKYTPALQSGRPVRVYFDAVVTFKIR